MLKLFREVKSGFQAAQDKVTMITNSVDAPDPLYKLTSSQLSSWLSHKHYEVRVWKTLASSAVIVSPDHFMTACLHMMSLLGTSQVLWQIWCDAISLAALPS